MTECGKTGMIHGIEVKPRTSIQKPTIDMERMMLEDREKVLEIARFVFEQHRSVFNALASR